METSIEQVQQEFAFSQRRACGLPMIGGVQLSVSVAAFR